MSTAVALPTHGDRAKWTAQEAALVEAAGLVRKQGDQTYLADRPTVEAFLAHCRRTQLDPIARQIYAIYRGGKWGIQISIDGARLVAERSGRYEGQTPVQWTADGVTWADVWLSDDYPKAARVGVFKTGFREPLYAVARWDSYVVQDDEWEGERGNRRKTGKKVVSSMWAKMPDLMLGKVAEMLALRKAFPQDLSGLYSTEEMQQADANTGGTRPSSQTPTERTAAPVAEEAPPTPEPSRDWIMEGAAASSFEELRTVYEAAEKAGELGLRTPDGEFIGAVLRGMRDRFNTDAPAPASASRDWLEEARAAESAQALEALVLEAATAGAPREVVSGMREFAESLPVDAEVVDEDPPMIYEPGDPIDDVWGGDRG